MPAPPAVRAPTARWRVSGHEPCARDQLSDVEGDGKEREGAHECAETGHRVQTYPQTPQEILPAGESCEQVGERAQRNELGGHEQRWTWGTQARTCLRDRVGCRGETHDAGGGEKGQYQLERS